MSYTLTLGNGKSFTDLTVSGTCFVSKTPVNAEDFSGGMNRVILSGTPASDFERAPFANGELPKCRFGNVFPADGIYYFYFEPISPEELAQMKAEADIDYLALMTGVEL